MRLIAFITAFFVAARIRWITIVVHDANDTLDQRLVAPKRGHKPMNIEWTILTGIALALALSAVHYIDPDVIHLDFNSSAEFGVKFITVEPDE